MKEAGAKSTAELIALLKFGEYEGADLMHIWCRLRQLDAENKRLKEYLKRVLDLDLDVASDEDRKVLDEIAALEGGDGDE